MNSFIEFARTFIWERLLSDQWFGRQNRFQGKRILGVFERGLNEMKGGRSVIGAISNENEMGEQKEGPAQ